VRKIVFLLLFSVLIFADSTILHKDYSIIITGKTKRILPDIPLHVKLIEGNKIYDIVLPKSMFSAKALYIKTKTHEYNLTNQQKDGNDIYITNGKIRHILSKRKTVLLR